MTKPVHAGDKPFPRHCPECGKIEVQPATIPYDAEIKHDGRLYAFCIPALRVNKCAACGEILFSNVTDDHISQALREHLNLLSPQEIRDRLAHLGLTQKEFGIRIAVAAETISRWLSGAYIQSRAYDKLMRFFFAHEEENRRTPTTGGVVITDGKLVPWSRSVSYQIAQCPSPPEAVSLDSWGEPIHGDLALAV